jgi:toxin ParE1/3/4
MLRPINRTDAAKNDLVGIWRYIAVEDEDIASSVIRFIDSRCQALCDHPETGHSREDLARGLRCLTVGKGGWRSKYLVFYRFSDNSVEIIRVLEGHRDITPEMLCDG